MVKSVSEYIKKAPKKGAPKETSKGFWHNCTKTDICEHKPYGKNHLRPLIVRPNVTDHEYIENWVQKLDLLCESKDRLGLLGSAFFAGILISLVIIPQLSDKFGRKYIFVTTLTLSLVAQVGLILS